MGNQHTKGQTKSLVEYSEMQFYKQERKVSDLDFADDIALLENDMFGSQKQLEKYSTNAEKVGLITHEEKTVFITRNIRLFGFLLEKLFFLQLKIFFLLQKIFLINVFFLLRKIFFL